MFATIHCCPCRAWVRSYATSPKHEAKRFRWSSHGTALAMSGNSACQSFLERPCCSKPKPLAGYTTLFPERKAIRDEYVQPVICSLLCLDAFYFPALTSFASSLALLCLSLKSVLSCAGRSESGCERPLAPASNAAIPVYRSVPLPLCRMGTVMCRGVIYL